MTIKGVKTLSEALKTAKASNNEFSIKKVYEMIEEQYFKILHESETSVVPISKVQAWSDLYHEACEAVN